MHFTTQLPLNRTTLPFAPCQQVIFSRQRIDMFTSICPFGKYLFDNDVSLFVDELCLFYFTTQRANIRVHVISTNNFNLLLFFNHFSKPSCTRNPITRIMSSRSDITFSEADLVSCSFSWLQSTRQRAQAFASSK